METTINEDIREAMYDIKRTVTIMLKNVWNVSELAMVLGISESRVRHLVAERALPHYKQNRLLYFRREEIEAWQTRHRIATAEEIDAKAATYCATHRLM